MDDFFLSTPGNPTSFLVDPWNFHTFYTLSLIPLEILCPHSRPPLPVCFSGFSNSIKNPLKTSCLQYINKENYSTHIYTPPPPRYTHMHVYIIYITYIICIIYIYTYTYTGIVHISYIIISTYTYIYAVMKTLCPPVYHHDNWQLMHLVT